ncbi:MAG: hypothetical protein IJR71_00420 [Prevotella sp.]|nr:hypothetical protein [Prevotella sp.]
MSWKNVKEHYGIKHIVQIDTHEKYGNTPCILIGSPYISDIIVIRISDAKILKRYGDGHVNGLLNELQPRLDEDEKNGTLKRLIDEPDRFGQLYPAYCIEDYRHIVKMRCEEYGYPNVTTSGKLMYENTFAPDEETARKYLLHRSKVNWEIWRWHVRDRFRYIWDEVKRLRYELNEVYNYLYVRCWGRFFIIEEKENK